MEFASVGDPFSAPGSAKRMAKYSIKYEIMNISASVALNLDSGGYTDFYASNRATLELVH